MAMKAKTTRKKRTNASTTGKSKKDVILGLLRRKSGACVSDLTKATDRQAHSVRGFLSRTIKKKLGLNLIVEKREGGAQRYFLRGGI